jgi:hypothetical protein
MVLDRPRCKARGAWWLAAAIVASASACAGPASHEPAESATDGGETSETSAGDAGGTHEAGSSSGTDAASQGDSTSPEGGSAGCSSLPLCDGFESDTPGMQPNGWKVVMGCNPTSTDGPVEGGGLVVGVDSSQHHSGNNSMRVVGGDSCGYYFVNTSAFSSLAGNQLYARFWVMFSTGPTQNHNGFLSMTTTGGDHFRMGFQDNVVDWNAQKSDATLPDMDPQGTSQSIAPAAMKWTCLELHIDETNGYLEVWQDDGSSPVAGLSWSGQSLQGVNDQWAHGAPSPPVPTDFGLGWLGLNNQETVWFDDVALGGARIGCN